MEFLIFLIALFALPFVLSLWIWGWNLCKREYLDLKLSKKKGIEKAVQTWQKMSPEERMVADLEEEISHVPVTKTEWVASPSPKDEEKAMNERVFREGIIHPLKQTELQDFKENKEDENR